MYAQDTGRRMDMSSWVFALMICMFFALSGVVASCDNDNNYGDHASTADYAERTLR